MRARQALHIPCHAHQAIPFTMSCIARPCHIPCYTSLDHTLYQVMPQAIPYAMPCTPGHTIYPMPARIYNIPCHASSGHTIHYAMPARPYLFLCNARHAIPYTMSFPSEHSTCHTRPYHIPYFGKSCHLSKGANALVTRCTIVCK